MGQLFPSRSPPLGFWTLSRTAYRPLALVVSAWREFLSVCAGRYYVMAAEELGALWYAAHLFWFLLTGNMSFNDWLHAYADTFARVLPTVSWPGYIRSSAPLVFAYAVAFLFCVPALR